MVSGVEVLECPLPACDWSELKLRLLLYVNESTLTARKRAVTCVSLKFLECNSRHKA